MQTHDKDEYLNVVEGLYIYCVSCGCVSQYYNVFGVIRYPLFTFRGGVA